MGLLVRLILLAAAAFALTNREAVAAWFEQADRRARSRDVDPDGDKNEENAEPTPHDMPTVSQPDPTTGAREDE